MVGRKVRSGIGSITNTSRGCGGWSLGLCARKYSHSSLGSSCIARTTTFLCTFARAAKDATLEGHTNATLLARDIYDIAPQHNTVTMRESVPGFKTSSSDRGNRRCVSQCHPSYPLWVQGQRTDHSIAKAYPANVQGG